MGGTLVLPPRQLGLIASDLSQLLGGAALVARGREMGSGNLVQVDLIATGD